MDWNRRTSRTPIRSSEEGDEDPCPWDILEELRRAGLLEDAPHGSRTLSGGISSELWMVRQGDRAFVVKRALERLRVADEWVCDTARNRNEQNYLREVSALAPGTVPRVLHADASRHFFVMEYLGDGWRNWKADLMEGIAEPVWGRLAGETLACIHRGTWEDARLREAFATGTLFFDLRIEPYLRTAGHRNPGLRDSLWAEADRLQGRSLALVHGDFSPKNILLHAAERRIVLLDCEVAWYGDPAFDAAFLLSHLFLKALRRPPLSAAYLEVATSFLDAYAHGMRGVAVGDLDDRVARLVLLLLVARIDGKSPVEYFVGVPRAQEFIRKFVTLHLSRSPSTTAALAGSWCEAISNP